MCALSENETGRFDKAVTIIYAGGISALRYLYIFSIYTKITISICCFYYYLIIHFILKNIILFITILE